MFKGEKEITRTTSRTLRTLSGVEFSLQFERIKNVCMKGKDGVEPSRTRTEIKG